MTESDAIVLSAACARTLGALVEKSMTTPDNYPLSLNSLRLACNQTTNRDPVVTYDDSTVETALGTLRDRHLVRRVKNPGERVIKHKHVAAEALDVDAAQLAMIGVLLLRGPQTPGELKQRTERMHDFGSLDAVEATLASLRERGLVVRLERRPGQKEVRWRTTLTDDSITLGSPGGADLVSDDATKSDEIPTLGSLDIVDVRSGETLRSIATDGEHEVAAKLTRARTAFTAWSARTRDDRVSLLLEFAANLATNVDEIAELAQREAGANFDVSREQLALSIDRLVIALDAASVPIGVVATITSADESLSSVLDVLGRSLVAGDVVLLKPATTATLRCLALVDRLHEVGVPADVVQCVIGGGATGSVLARAGVDLVRFVGSHDAGARVVLAAGERGIAVEASLRVAPPRSDPISG